MRGGGTAALGATFEVIVFAIERLVSLQNNKQSHHCNQALYKRHLYLQSLSSVGRQAMSCPISLFKAKNSSRRALSTSL